MLDEILELFGRKQAKGRGDTERRDMSSGELDDDAYGRRRRDDDHDDDDDLDDHRNSHERPSKKRRFGDLLDMG